MPLRAHKLRATHSCLPGWCGSLLSMGRGRVPGQPSRGDRVARVIGLTLWVLIPALTLGFFAFVPAVHVAVRARTRGWWLVGGLMVTATAGQWTAMIQDLQGPGPGFLIMGVVSGGIAAAIAGREVVFGASKKKVDPAIEAVLDDRERREQARAIAAADPEMAIELGIGRPALRRKFKDGGLIDLNNATSRSIAKVLGWPASVADEFVAERDVRHGFDSLTEIGAMSSLDPTLLEDSSDRVVVLPYQG